jgi:branched-chain amino acid transport system substrate-binding protein
VLMQNDDYGKDYWEGFKEGMGKEAGRIVKHVTYEVTDPTVDSQVIQLKDSGANVFFNIATPKFATQAIKKAAEIGWRPVHYLNNVATSVGGVIKPAGFDAAQGIITTAYLKDPTAPQFAEWPDVVEWHKFIDTYLPQADKTSSWFAYAYAVSATLEEALKRSGDELTRANVMKQAASLHSLEVPMLLPHLKVNTTGFNPIQSVRLQRFLGERWDYSLAAWLAFVPQEAQKTQPPAPALPPPAPKAVPAVPKAAPAKAAPAKAAPAKAAPAGPKATKAPPPAKKQATQ